MQLRTDFHCRRRGRFHKVYTQTHRHTHTLNVHTSLRKTNEKEMVCALCIAHARQLGAKMKNKRREKTKDKEMKAIISFVSLCVCQHILSLQGHSLIYPVRNMNDAEKREGPQYINWATGRKCSRVLPLSLSTRNCRRSSTNMPLWIREPLGRHLLPSNGLRQQTRKDGLGKGRKAEKKE